MKVKPLFAWYDFWVGFFWDGKGRKLYFLPVPCIGVVINFAPAVSLEKKDGGA